jgi:hypothetical protein
MIEATSAGSYLGAVSQTETGDQTGEAAKAVAKVLHNHFNRCLEITHLRQPLSRQGKGFP